MSTVKGKAAATSRPKERRQIMIINVNGTEKNLCIKQWDGGQYYPDCAADLLAPDVKDGQSMTEQEYADLVEYCESELTSYNNGYDTDLLGSRYPEWNPYYDDESADKGPDNGEFAVFAD